MTGILPPPQVMTLFEILRKRQLSVAFAESCTGGLLSHWMTQQAGVSEVFRGSVVAYSGGVKTQVLGVPAAMLRAYGEVSRPVARAMAVGVCSALSATWSVSVTGVAGPGGGTLAKPVGFVCFGVAGPSFAMDVETRFYSLERAEIQHSAAIFAFDLLLNELN